MMNSEEEGYYLAVNEFADLTAREFKMRLGYKRAARDQPVAYSESFEERNDNPKTVDWRD